MPTQMTSFFFITALLCYVVIGIYFVRSLKAMADNLKTDTQNTQSDTSSKEINANFKIKRSISLFFLFVGFCCHILTLYPVMFNANGNVNFNLFNIMSLTSLLMLGFSILFSSYRPVIVLNVLAAPIATVGLILGYINPKPANITNMTKLSLSMDLHILFSIAAYSVLLMAALQAILLRLQNRELKHITKTRIWVALLPALQSMEKLLFDMIMVGFVLLTLALGLGLGGITDLLAQKLAHKTVFSVLAWTVFAWLIFGHWKFGWRGTLAANMTLWGFGLLAMGFVGTKFVLEIILVSL